MEGRPREWLAAREVDLLPVGYFHFVFTVPAEIAVAQRPSAAARSAVDRKRGAKPNCGVFNSVQVVAARRPGQVQPLA